MNSLDNGGRNHFAGSAPCGEAVKDDEMVLVLQGLPVVVDPIACVSLLIPRQVTSLFTSKRCRE